MEIKNAWSSTIKTETYSGNGLRPFTGAIPHGFCEMNVKANYIISGVLAGASALVIAFAPILLLPDFKELTFYLALGSMLVISAAMILSLCTAIYETNSSLSIDKISIGEISDKERREYSEAYRERRSK